MATPFVDEVPGIWIHSLARDGRTSGSCVLRDGDTARVRWTADPEAGRLVIAGQRIELVAITRHFGGRRFFALCPKCGSRRARLHLGEEGFRCRDCYVLVYDSTRENRAARALRRTAKLRARLGASPAPGTPLARPPGMWRGRFLRFVRAVTAADRAAYGALNSHLDRFERRHGLGRSLDAG